MGKRKANGDSTTPSKEKMEVDEDDSGSDDDNETINIEFDFFDPNPDIDFHGLKTLLRQLFDVDNQLCDLSELANMILAQPTLGSTIKCDGMETDPWAFLTVLNLHEHRQNAAIQQITKYLLERSAASLGEMQTTLAKLLDPNASESQIGLILTERFINFPSELVPSMYTMLGEEIEAAILDKEPYNFTHYLIISKSYTEVESQLDDDSRPVKKAKAKKGGKDELFYFHPEDEVLRKHAVASCDFQYVKGEDGTSDSKRAFQEVGVRPQGLMILIEGSKFEGAVEAVREYLGAK